MKKFFLILLIALPITLFAQVYKTENGEYACNLKLEFPKVYVKNSTLNSDNGISIQSNCELISYSLKIYDRWGSIVFSSISKDDIIDFSKLKTNVYVWMVAVTYANETNDNLKGTITIIEE